ncbi:uncharacterized protein EV420DRAFT_1529048 [Desarmillaria tabescens]|uniref:F-box domain-containing protein n=1 Tax=Armillaria tabescens TaxID=1929756 RepID=A0AA39N8C3_ARMTA|nr:uncharacterized protein EV420DRAFT_1529048 [Desarmillaria tabescens]KAK0460897.1 hypothetical protein EV420DRAFT_1529048 [Desarmillaria tabescens]
MSAKIFPLLLVNHTSVQVVLNRIEMPTTLNDLPSELLAHIFTETLPSDEYVYLSNKCVISWRLLTLSSPELWCSFQVKPPTYCNPHLIRVWLDHSNDRLLSFKIDYSAHSFSYADAAHLLRALRLASTRWERVNLLLPGSNSLFRDAFVNADMPHLRELSLYVVRGSEADIMELNTFLFSNDAPLEKFTWGFSSSWGARDYLPGRLSGRTVVNAPWSRLTHLKLDTCVTVEEACTILSKCHALVECDIRRFSPPGYAHISVVNLPAITLQNLTSLSLYTINLVTMRDPLTRFFSHLLCPNLRKVAFTCGFTNRFAWPQNRVHIVSPAVVITGISESNLCQCLEVMSSSLRHLALYDSGENVCVSDELAGLIEGSLCPLLENLVLHRAVRCSADGTLAKMIELRQESLQKFRWCPVPGDDYGHVKDLRLLKKISGYGLEQTWEWERNLTRLQGRVI